MSRLLCWIGLHRWKRHTVIGDSDVCNWWLGALILTCTRCGKVKP